MPNAIDWDKVIPKEVRKQAASMPAEEVVALLLNLASDFSEKAAGDPPVVLQSDLEDIVGVAYLAAARLLQSSARSG